MTPPNGETKAVSLFATLGTGTGEQGWQMLSQTQFNSGKWKKYTENLVDGTFSRGIVPRRQLNYKSTLLGAGRDSPTHSMMGNKEETHSIKDKKKNS